MRAFILAEVDGRICGYVLFWLLPGSIDVHNIATAPDCRRLGIARMMMQQVVAAAAAQSATRVTLEFGSQTSQLKDFIYRLVSVKQAAQGYYADDGEDALTMALELDT